MLLESFEFEALEGWRFGGVWDRPRPNMLAHIFVRQFIIIMAYSSTKGILE